MTDNEMPGIETAVSAGTEYVYVETINGDADSNEVEHGLFVGLVRYLDYRFAVLEYGDRTVAVNLEFFKVMSIRIKNTVATHIMVFRSDENSEAEETLKKTFELLRERGFKKADGELLDSSKFKYEFKAKLKEEAIGGRLTEKPKTIAAPKYEKPVEDGTRMPYRFRRNEPLPEEALESMLKLIAEIAGGSAPELPAFGEVAKSRAVSGYGRDYGITYMH